MIGIWAAIFAMELYPTIRRYCADRGYRGTFLYDINSLLKCGVDISEGIKSGKRWIVERTFAWLNNSRRLSKDYEIRTSSAEAMIKLSHIHTLLKRL